MCVDHRCVPCDVAVTAGQPPDKSGGYVFIAGGCALCCASSTSCIARKQCACVIAVFTKDVADTKAKEATELGKQNGYPLYFTTEPEE